MSMTFTKLFASITESTIWVAPDTHRLTWIAMLAMSDRAGRVWGSIPGLANRARVPVEAAREAIASFLMPDPDSRTKEHEGRRIEEIDGGWRLLNHAKYRAIRDHEAILESKRKYISARRAKEAGNRHPTMPNVETNVENVDRGRGNAEAEAEALSSKTLKTLSDKSDIKPLAIDILNFLNSKTGRAYRPTSTNLGFIIARLRDGATPVDCRQVITKKVRDWTGDEKMAPYLRPATLFNKVKFDQYSGELVVDHNAP